MEAPTSILLFAFTQAPLCAQSRYAVCFRRILRATLTERRFKQPVRQRWARGRTAPRLPSSG
jgi:hypothetical protein